MRKAMKYEILTWDPELEEFTPQIGLPKNPMGPRKFRQACKLLSAMGYGDIHGPCVQVTVDGELLENLN